MKGSLVMTDGNGARVIDGSAVDDAVLRNIEKEIGEIQKTRGEVLMASRNWRGKACSNLPARIRTLIDFYCSFALSKADILEQFKSYKHQWVGEKTIIALEKWTPAK